MAENNHLGEVVAVGFDDSLAASADPATGTYKVFGLTNSKSLSATANTINVNTDSTGSVDDNLATGQSVEFTVSGFSAKQDVLGSINQAFLQNLFHTRLEAGDQPTLWLEVVYPGKTQYIFAHLTSYSESGASKEAYTIEFSFTSTSTNTPGNSAIQFVYTPPV